MNTLERAARALLHSEGAGELSWDDLDLITRGALKRDVVAALQAIREPDEGMADAGQDVLWERGCNPLNGDFEEAWATAIDHIIREAPVAKNRRKGKNTTKVPKPANDEDGKRVPTDERARFNDFRSMGMAKRLVPVIVRLHEDGLLDDREFVALAYYRDQASLADKSPVKSCIDFSVRGGSGPGVAILSAQLETWRIERDLGELWGLVRAVAVDDITLDQWCLANRGSRRFDEAGAPLAEPMPYPEHVGIAAMELKYAAGGIVAGRA